MPGDGAAEPVPVAGQERLVEVQLHPQLLATCCGVASAPSSAWAASPGSRFSTAKLRKVTPQTTGIAVSSRRPTSRSRLDRKHPRHQRSRGVPGPRGRRRGPGIRTQQPERNGSKTPARSLAREPDLRPQDLRPHRRGGDQGGQPWPGHVLGRDVPPVDREQERRKGILLMYSAAWLYSVCREAVLSVEVALAKILSRAGSCTPLKIDAEPNRKFTPRPAGRVERPRRLQRRLPGLALELLDDRGQLVDVDRHLHARRLPHRLQRLEHGLGDRALGAIRSTVTPPAAFTAALALARL